MTSSTPMLPSASFARLLYAAFLLLVPSVARAHIALRSSEPAKGSILTTPPARIVLAFTMRPQLGFSRVTLIGPGGDVPLGSLVADSTSAVRADIPSELRPGSYTIRWQTASADGHVIRGEFAFTLATPDRPADTAAPAAEHVHQPAQAATDSSVHAHRPESHIAHPGYRWVRWLEFIAIVTILGVLGFRKGVLPPLAARGVPTADASDRARRFGHSTLVLYVLAAGYRLYSESAWVHGEENALDPAMLSRMLTDTTWGAGWLTGIVGAVLVSAGWWAARRRIALATPLAMLGGLAIATSPALSGHAAAGSPMLLSVAADALHVLAAGVWTGGLLIVLLAGIPSMRRAPSDTHPAVAALVNSFHPLALFCVPLVILSGGVSAWLRLGGVTAVVTTPYGRTLLLKLGVFAIIAGTGFYNSARARKQLGTEAATRRLRITATIEILFVALLLAVTTWLVVTPVPSDPTAS